MTFYNVQSLLDRNQMIIKGRPHSWRTIRCFASKEAAKEYCGELRQGAKEVNLPYRYRVKQVEATYP